MLIMKNRTFSLQPFFRQLAPLRLWLLLNSYGCGCGWQRKAIRSSCTYGLRLGLLL